jgi:hypothetical protein
MRSRVKHFVRTEIVIVGIMLASALVGCTETRKRIASRSLASGERIATLAAPRGLTVFLVYDPADCLGCNGALGSWIDWGRSHPARFKLLFSRSPNPDEARQLTLYRVRSAGVLSPSLWYSSKALGRPREVIFVDGVEIASSELGRAIRTPLLEAVDSLTEGDLGRLSPAALRGVVQ